MSNTAGTRYHTVTEQLEALAGDLSRRGFATKLTSGVRHPSVTVTNRDAAMLSETIYAAPADGEVWFWWSWAERLTPITEAARAALAIAHVLSP